MERRRRGIQSVEVGGRLLDALARTTTPMMLKDIAAAADLAPAQAHAYLSSYRRVGLVEQDAATGRYLVGPFAVRLAVARLKTVPELVAVTDAVSRLGRDLGLMATATIWTAHGPTVVHRHDGDETLNVNVRLGTLFSLRGTATGRIFLAFGDATRVAERLAREAAQPVAETLADGTLADGTGPDAVAAVRRDGYALIEEAPVPGVNALAAPVFAANGAVFAVLTLIGTSKRLPVTAVNNPVLSRVLAAARTLTAAMSAMTDGSRAETMP